LTGRMIRSVIRAWKIVRLEIFDEGFNTDTDETTDETEKIRLRLSKLVHR
jgi:hypothetical protein